MQARDRDTERESNGLASLSSPNHRCCLSSRRRICYFQLPLPTIATHHGNFTFFPSSVILSLSLRAEAAKKKREIEFLQQSKHVLRGTNPPFMLCVSNSSSPLQPASSSTSRGPNHSLHSRFLSAELPFILCPHFCLLCTFSRHLFALFFFLFFSF